MYFIPSGCNNYYINVLYKMINYINKKVLLIKALEKCIGEKHKMKNSTQEVINETKIDENKEQEITDLSTAQSYGGIKYPELKEGDKVPVTLAAVKFVATGKTGKNQGNDTEFDKIDIKLTYEGGPFEAPLEIRYGGMRRYGDNEYWINTSSQTKRKSHAYELLSVVAKSLEQPTTPENLEIPIFMRALKSYEGKTVLLTGLKTINLDTDKFFMKPMIIEMIEE